MTGTFSDGTTSSPETFRFDGTAASGALISARTGEPQGSYRVEGGEVELRLPGGLTIKGRILSADIMEGTFPDGHWRGERKRAGSVPAQGSRGGGR